MRRIGKKYGKKPNQRKKKYKSSNECHHAVKTHNTAVANFKTLV
jgi:hypothetical protein